MRQGFGVALVTLSMKYGPRRYWQLPLSPWDVVAQRFRPVNIGARGYWSIESLMINMHLDTSSIFSRINLPRPRGFTILFKRSKDIAPERP